MRPSPSIHARHAWRGHALEQKAKIGIARARKVLHGDEPSLGSAGRALDKLCGSEGDGAAGQGQRHAVGDRFGAGVAVEKPDGPEIELRVRHAACLSTTRR